jgi:hypothetical protein
MILFGRGSMQSDRSRLDVNAVLPHPLGPDNTNVNGEDNLTGHFDASFILKI